jgi:hypothetical protein
MFSENGQTNSPGMDTAPGMPPRSDSVLRWPYFSALSGSAMSVSIGAGIVGGDATNGDRQISPVPPMPMLMINLNG